jgi:diacylglycerol kinase (ATP)
MDILIIKDTHHLEMADMLFKVLWQDIRQNRYVFSTRASRCLIQCEAPIPLTIDGEYGGKLPLEIVFLNKALTVFIP